MPDTPAANGTPPPADVGADAEPGTQLRLPARLESLQRIRDFVTEAARIAELDRMPTYRLRLAVDEIATNIIVHGFAEQAEDGWIVLRAEMDAAELTIVLEDAARAYDPREQPRPLDLSAPLEDREIGGLGVFLAVDGVDRFSYEREDTLNRNVFTMKRTPVGEPASRPAKT
jgi:serine/threonine-protein kinase RsbW